MNLDQLAPDYRERIEKNQKAYIQSFQRSLAGRFCCLFWRLTGLEPQGADATIERINRSRLLNRWQWFILELKGLKFHLTQGAPILHSTDKTADTLSACCMIKNEGAYIKEWVDFHLAVGVERFYVLDNCSNDNTRQILDPYIQAGVVRYYWYPGKTAQIFGYNDVLRICRGRTKWLIFMDPDEFLFPTHCDDLRELLPEYEDAPAVMANWVMFGPGGHEKKPEGLVIENFTQTFLDDCNERNCRAKSIVQPGKTLCMAGTHFGLFKGGALAVDENHRPITGAALYVPRGRACTYIPSIEKLRMNHYWTKSLEELDFKCRRGYADGVANLRRDYALQIVDQPMKEDRAILRFVPRVREIGMQYAGRERK